MTQGQRGTEWRTSCSTEPNILSSTQSQIHSDQECTTRLYEWVARKYINGEAWREITLHSQLLHTCFIVIVTWIWGIMRNTNSLFFRLKKTIPWKPSCDPVTVSKRGQKPGVTPRQYMLNPKIRVFLIELDVQYFGKSHCWQIIGDFLGFFEEVHCL